MAPSLRRRNVVIGGAAALVIALIVAGIAGTQTATSSDDVVAKIGNRIITRAEFEEQFARQPEHDPSAADSLRRALLESLIHKELLVLEAKKRGLFDARVDSMAQRFGEDLLRQEMKAEEARIDSTITDDEVTRAFEQSLTEMRMRHIINFWARGPVDSARARIAAGEPFAEVAAAMSLDKTTAAEGGLLPWLTARQLIEEFRRKLDPPVIGKVVGPFESPYGWHLVVVDSLRQREGADLAAEREAIEAGILGERRFKARNAALAAYREKYNFKLDADATMATLAEAEAAFKAAAEDSLRRNEPVADQWRPSTPGLVLATYTDGQITVADYHKLAAAGGLPFVWRRVTPPGILADVREMFYEEARLREARTGGLDQDPAWTKRIELKREEHAVDRLYNEEVMRDVNFTDEDLRAYYDSHLDQFPQPEIFRYSFMQVDDASVAQWLVQEFESVAKVAFDTTLTANGQQEAAALFDSLHVEVEQTGHFLRAERDSGRREASTTGAVADAARGMKPGYVGHVVEDYGAHTVFILMSYEPAGTWSFEKVRERVRRTMNNIESEERLTALLDALKQEFGVESYPDRLGPG